MIWIKTDAGRAEVQLRALVKDRSLRTLLMLIDGKKSQAAVLQSLPGSTAEDFRKLGDLGLIALLAADTPAVFSAPVLIRDPTPASHRRTLAPAESKISSFR